MSNYELSKWGKKRKIAKEKAKEKAVRQAEAIENVPKIDTFFKKPHIDGRQSQNSNLIHLSHDALPGTSRTNLEDSLLTANENENNMNDTDEVDTSDSDFGDPAKISVNINSETIDSLIKNPIIQDLNRFDF